MSELAEFWEFIQTVEDKMIEYRNAKIQKTVKVELFMPFRAPFGIGNTFRDSYIKFI